MRWPAVFDKSNYQPMAGESRPEFLHRIAVNGFPSLGYAEPVRSLVWELTREVVALRDEVDSLRSELSDLRANGGRR